MKYFKSLSLMDKMYEVALSCSRSHVKFVVMSNM